MEQIVFIVFTIKLVFVAKIKCKWDSGKDECTVAVKTIQNHIKRHLQFCKKACPHVATPPIGYNLYYNLSCAKPVWAMSIDWVEKKEKSTFQDIKFSVKWNKILNKNSSEFNADFTIFKW